MLQIPKLAKGGIITNCLPLICAGEKGEKIYPLKDKYYQIYKHTKSKRIKKKQEKKSWTLKMKRLLDNALGNSQVRIFVNDREITKEV